MPEVKSLTEVRAAAGSLGIRSEFARADRLVLMVGSVSELLLVSSCLSRFGTHAMAPTTDVVFESLQLVRRRSRSQLRGRHPLGDERRPKHDDQATNRSLRNQ